MLSGWRACHRFVCRCVPPIETCGDEDVRNVDVLLYDTQGNVVKRDDTIDREPKLEFSPEETGTYYIVLYQRDIDVTKDEAGVAMAVVYR